MSFRRRISELLFWLPKPAASCDYVKLMVPSGAENCSFRRLAKLIVSVKTIVSIAIEEIRKLLTKAMEEVLSRRYNDIAIYSLFK